MSIVQELTRRQIRSGLAEAIRRRVPASLTCRSGQAWYNMHTEVLRLSPQGLFLAWPEECGADAADISPGLDVCLTFKIKHHKHIVNTTVEAVGRSDLDGEGAAHVIRVAYPERMQRVQRRAYQRTGVPADRSVLATFWHPEETDAESPPSRGLSWEGWLTDLSAGGFQVRLAAHGAPVIENGEVVRVRIDLGQDYRPIVADARFRHELDERPGVIHQGFQFVGLNETEQGRDMLARVADAVVEFSRHAAKKHGAA